LLIEYGGQTLDTMYYKELSDEEFEFYRNEYYKKPNFKDVQDQFLKISRGSTTNNLITDYYVKDLMAKTRIYYNKWCVEDVFNSKGLLGSFVDRCEKKPEFYGVDTPMIDRIEQAIRLGGKGIASKPANFPIKTVDLILRKYNVNNNYYDFSCGWGARLTGALKNNVNYFGTDPNYMLVPRLKQLANDYLDVMRNDSVVDLFGTNEEQTKVDIRCQGSEEFVPEWENKIGVAFSSPPYFYLEDYKIGKQSYTEGTTYEQWKTNYLLPTMQNIYKYLVKNGYYILNINNFDKYSLVEDCIELAESVGFKYKEDVVLDNIKRCTEVGFNDNNERVMVFTK
jgi:hypothetical protein